MKLVKKSYFHRRWRHYDVIIMQFSMYKGQKLKMLYLWNSWSYTICSYIVGKYLPSSKRWFIIEMDMSVPDREISVLNSAKIPEKSEKSQLFVGGLKMSTFKKWFIKIYAFYIYICIYARFFSHLPFCVLIRIWLEIRIFPPITYLKHALLNYIKTHKTAFKNSVVICSDNKFWVLG